MTAELIYCTTSPAAEAWWRHAMEMRRQESALRRAFEDEMLGAYGPADVREWATGHGKRLLWVSDRGVTGLDSGSYEQPPAGSGWRLDSKDRIWKPALRTAEGKALQKRLRGLTLYVAKNHYPEIGVPQMVWGDGYVYWAGLEHDDDPFALYQTWGSGQCVKDCLAEQAKHPEVEWSEVPRSQWYARLEARKQASA